MTLKLTWGHVLPDGWEFSTEIERLSDDELLASYVPLTDKRHPATNEPGYDGDEMAARARALPRRKS